MNDSTELKPLLFKATDIVYVDAGNSFESRRKNTPDMLTLVLESKKDALDLIEGLKGWLSNTSETALLKAAVVRVDDKSAYLALAATVNGEMVGKPQLTRHAIIDQRLARLSLTSRASTQPAKLHLGWLKQSGPYPDVQMIPTSEYQPFPLQALEFHLARA